MQSPYESVIFLSMQKIDADFFRKVLVPHAPNTGFVHMATLRPLEDNVHKLRIPKRLLSFCSPHIVSGPLLKALDYNAYNFHPGPPDRPGYMPSYFAIQEKAKRYGVTMHQMVERVDEGFIVEADLYDLAPGISQEDLEMEAYKKLLGIVVARAKELADVSFQFEPSGDQWSGVKTTKRELEEHKRNVKEVSDA